MSSPDESTGKHKTPAKARAGREAEPLKVAQIYAVAEARAYPTGDATLVVRIGDEACVPHAHGLRASREHWVQFVNALIDADPCIGARLRLRAA